MTQPSRAYLDEAVSQLARAWSKRSPAERSAFADRLAAVTGPPEPPDSALLTVRERAALCGAVSPSDLARGLDGEDASRALDVLAPEFDRVHAAGQWKWTLRTAPRRDALAALVRNGRLLDRLAEVAEIRTDRAGELLRYLAVTRSPRTDVEDGSAHLIPEDPPATVVQALTWARPLGGFDGDLAEARRRAAVRLLSQGYGALTRHGVFGRDRELAQLTDFAEGPLDRTKPGASPVPVLPLTGIGGAGKSTVLGAFVKPYLDRIEEGDPDPSVPAVVVLNFNRVLFRPTAELELSFELTRQLGYAAAAAADDFSALRRQLREEQRQSGSDRHVSNVRSDSATRESSAFERSAGNLVRTHSLGNQRVLLVLDTFEEWQRECVYVDPTPWNAPERRILEWISRIRSSMALQNLRVIVSGRASLGETGDPPHPNVLPQLIIGDLDTPSARDMLRALGIAAPDAGTIVDLVGGNPLTLHIAARFYRGLDPAARRDFLAGDPLSAEELTVDLRKAVLYERFLAHIPDEQVRKLAHPGLLLRRVTHELVRHVLAGPCGLGEIDERRAKRLTERLADEVWLVQKTPNGLYHRRDVRGPMLKLMAGDPAYQDVTRQIHTNAVRWYESSGDGRDRLPRDRARVEAFYHSLMLKTGDEPVAPEHDPGRERWLLLAQQLGQAVDELPARVAAQVRVLRGDQIADQDANLLPDRVWQLWIEQRGKALVDNGESAAALDLFDIRQSLALPEWLGQACSDAGQWHRYWPTVRAPGSRRVDYFFSSDRYALLNALLSGDRGNLVDYQAALSEYFSVLLDGDAATVPTRAERVFCRLLIDLGISRGQPGTVPWRPSAAYGTGSGAGDQDVADRFPVDELRRVMTWIGTSPEDQDFVIGNAASFGLPDRDGCGISPSSRALATRLTWTPTLLVSAVPLATIRRA